MKHPKIWSDKKRAPSVKNAYGHWKKHGSEFPQYNNAIEYVEGAHSFAKNPPSGTMSKTKSQRDKVFYHQESNTFMIQASHDAPRTMFKPDPSKHGYATNLDYFNAQQEF